MKKSRKEREEENLDHSSKVTGSGSFKDPFKVTFNKIEDFNTIERILEYPRESWIITSEGKLVRFRSGVHDKAFFIHIKTKEPFHQILNRMRGTLPRRNCYEIAKKCAQRLSVVFPELFRLKKEIDFEGFIEALKDDLNTTIEEYKSLPKGSEGRSERKEMIHHIEKTAKIMAPLLNAREHGMLGTTRPRMSKRIIGTVADMHERNGKTFTSITEELREDSEPEVKDITSEVQIKDLL